MEEDVEEKKKKKQKKKKLDECSKQAYLGTRYINYLQLSIIFTICFLPPSVYYYITKFDTEQSLLNELRMDHINEGAKS